MIGRPRWDELMRLVYEGTLARSGLRTGKTTFGQPYQTAGRWQVDAYIAPDDLAAFQDELAGWGAGSCCRQHPTYRSIHRIVFGDASAAAMFRLVYGGSCERPAYSWSGDEVDEDQR